MGQNASGSDLLNLAIDLPLPASKKFVPLLGAGTITCDADDACRRGNCIRLRACGITGRMKKELRPVIGTAICLRSRANTQSGHEAAPYQDDAEIEMKPHSEILWDP